MKAKQCLTGQRVIKPRDHLLAEHRQKVRVRKIDNGTVASEITSQIDKQSRCNAVDRCDVMEIENHAPRSAHPLHNLANDGLRRRKGKIALEFHDVNGVAFVAEPRALGRVPCSAGVSLGAGICQAAAVLRTVRRIELVQFPRP